MVNVFLGGTHRKGGEIESQDDEGIEHEDSVGLGGVDVGRRTCAGHKKSMESTVPW